MRVRPSMQPKIIHRIRMRKISPDRFPIMWVKEVLQTLESQKKFIGIDPFDRSQSIGTRDGRDLTATVEKRRDLAQHLSIQYSTTIENLKGWIKRYKILL